MFSAQYANDFAKPANPAITPWFSFCSMDSGEKGAGGGGSFFTDKARPNCTLQPLHCNEKFIHAAGNHHWSRQNIRLIRTVPLKSSKQIFQVNFFLLGCLEGGHWRKEQDPDPLIRDTDPQIRIGSVPKYHGSGALLVSFFLGISIGGGAPLCPCLYIVQVKKSNALSVRLILKCFIPCYFCCCFMGSAKSVLSNTT